MTNDEGQGTMSTIIPERELPAQLTPELVVEAAYAQDLAEVTNAHEPHSCRGRVVDGRSWERSLTPAASYSPSPNIIERDMTEVGSALGQRAAFARNLLVRL